MTNNRQNFNQFMQTKNVTINCNEIESFRKFILEECGWRNTIDYIIIKNSENNVVFSWELE